MLAYPLSVLPQVAAHEFTTAPTSERLRRVGVHVVVGADAAEAYRERYGAIRAACAGRRWGTRKTQESTPSIPKSTEAKSKRGR